MKLKRGEDGFHKLESGQRFVVTFTVNVVLKKPARISNLSCMFTTFGLHTFWKFWVLWNVLAF